MLSDIRAMELMVPPPSVSFLWYLLLLCPSYGTSSFCLLYPQGNHVPAPLSPLVFVSQGNHVPAPLSPLVFVSQGNHVPAAAFEALALPRGIQGPGKRNNGGGGASGRRGSLGQGAREGKIGEGGNASPGNRKRAVSWV